MNVRGIGQERGIIRLWNYTPVSCTPTLTIPRCRCRSFDAEHDLFLVLGFSAGTRVLGLNADEELEEVEVPGLSSQEQTLLCANLLGSVVCQVTPRGVNLADAASGQRLDTWHAPDDQPITLASANATQVGCGIFLHRVVCRTMIFSGQMILREVVFFDVQSFRIVYYADCGRRGHELSGAAGTGRRKADGVGCAAGSHV